MSIFDLWNYIGAWGLVCVSGTRADGTICEFAFANIMQTYYSLRVPGDMHAGYLMQTLESNKMFKLAVKSLRNQAGFKCEYWRRKLPYALFEGRGVITLSSELGLDELPRTEQCAQSLFTPRIVSMGTDDFGMSPVSDEDDECRDHEDDDVDLFELAPAGAVKIC